MDEAKSEQPTMKDMPASPPAGAGQKRLPWWQELLETLLTALLVFALSRLVVQNFRIEGPSMEPNLHDGQFLVVNKLAYWRSLPRRGDIVVFRYPRNPKRDFIKRVVGLPGESLEIVRGQVFINGQPLQEPYLFEPADYSRAATVIEPNHVFVLGDNRNNSSDSHLWGSVPMHDIVGKAVFCYWPPQYWGPVRHEQPVESLP